MPATAQQVISSLQQLTQKYQNLQAPAQSITILNGPLLVIGQGPYPQLIVGFTDIVTTGTTMIAYMQDTSKFTEQSDQTAILDAFKQHVRVAQVTLNILIGKSALTTQAPFIGPPMGSVLRQVEAIEDTIAFALLDACENIQSDFQPLAASLSATLSQTIDSYTNLQAKL